jgi:ATP-dependent RNA helicase RhlE
MYYNNRFRQRASIRHSGAGPRFSKPAQKGKFNNPRFSSNRGNIRKSQLEGADINIFIKKAMPITNQATAVNMSFVDFEIAQNLKLNIKNHGYIIPTPIQSQAIKPILEGRDVIGLASTGTGKTAAFLIPLIDKVFKDRSQKVLIIVPTRELAVQINEELRSFSLGMGIYSALVIGGANMNRQMQDIRRGSNIVISTPGRLKDLIERREINLLNFANIVLDEVDLMVDIGFIADVKYFISQMPKVRQSLFFSATIPSKVQSILQSFVTNPVTVSVKPQETSENVNQDVIKILSSDKKLDQLHDLLIKDGFNKVLIFGRTKHGIEKLNKELEFRGFKTGALHGNKNQGQRRRVLESFKQNQIQILLATDVASRGLDIDNVTHVINYDLPQTYDDYIHRIGRTGRAGKVGNALTFVS